MDPIRHKTENTESAGKRSDFLDFTSFPCRRVWRVREPSQNSFSGRIWCVSFCRMFFTQALSFLSGPKLRSRWWFDGASVFGTLFQPPSLRLFFRSRQRHIHACGPERPGTVVGLSALPKVWLSAAPLALNGRSPSKYPLNSFAATRERARYVRDFGRTPTRTAKNTRKRLALMTKNNQPPFSFMPAVLLRPTALAHPTCPTCHAGTGTGRRRACR